jgi:hypothetical protein
MKKIIDGLVFTYRVANGEIIVHIECRSEQGKIVGINWVKRLAKGEVIEEAFDEGIAWLTNRFNQHTRPELKPGEVRPLTQRPYKPAGFLRRLTGAEVASAYGDSLPVDESHLVTGQWDKPMTDREVKQ